MRALTASIIIPHWRGEATLPACLAALNAAMDHAGVACEVIVVDNGGAGTGDWGLGTGDSVHAPRTTHHGDRGSGIGDSVHAPRTTHQSPNLPITQSPNHPISQSPTHNFGFAGGCNLGMGEAGGEWLILLNQDTVVAREWLAALLGGVGKPGVYGCLILGEDGRVEHAGGRVDWPLGLTRHLGQGERAVGGWLEPSQPDFVTGAAMSIHRSVVDAIGPLDEQFWPGYFEDADFCLRARAAGFPVGYVPAARLTHAAHSSFGEGHVARWARLRGRLRFVLKHLPPERFLADFLPAEEAHRPAVLDGDRDGQIARAYVEAAAMLPELWTDRATPAQIRRAADGLNRLYAPQPWLLPAPGLDSPASSPLPDLTPILTDSPLDRLPFIGPVWQQARRAIHQLVIFYVLRRTRQLEAHIHPAPDPKMER